MTDARIERLETTGVIMREQGGFELTNNVWLVGDDESVLVIDAAHDAAAIARAVGERETLGILLTHGHEDHVNAAVDAAHQLDTHLYLHPADLFLWRATHGERLPDFELADGAVFAVAGIELTVLHTPGHTPGSVSFSAPALGTVFSGDTLFQGGPGATRWDYSSFPQIIESIETRLFDLAGSTAVLPGHGEHTSIALERPMIEEYRTRGW